MSIQCADDLKPEVPVLPWSGDDRDSALVIRRAMALDRAPLDAFREMRLVLRTLRAAHQSAMAGVRSVPGGEDVDACFSSALAAVRAQGDAGDDMLNRYGTALASMPYADYLATTEWQDTRAITWARFGRACALCSGADRLHVHHRTYVRRGWEAAEDLTLLCAACHGSHHGARR